MIFESLLAAVAEATAHAHPILHTHSPLMKNQVKLNWLPLFIALPVLAATPLAAQTAAEPGPVYDLAAFEVSVDSDRGYLSTNAVSGTSLNMAIRDLPMPLEVINQELIEDLQATDFKEAIAYSAGVYTQTFQNNTGANRRGSQERSPSTASDVNNPFANAISIRGYAVPNQQRLGFRVGSIAVGEGFSVVLGGITDTANVERLEVVRGPASLLYGVNVLSGVVNMMPKEPLFRNQVRLQVSTGSHDFYRGTLDVTGPLVSNKLAYRFVANHQENEHWTQYRSDRQEFYVGQLKWQPTPKISLLLEGQYADQSARGIGPQFFRDTFVGQSFQIDRNPANTLDFRNPYNEFVRFGRDLPDAFMTRDTNNPADVWLLPKSTPLVPQDNLDLGDNYRISGPDTFNNRREVNALALLRATPMRNFNIELGGYYTRVKQLERNVDMAVYGNSEGPISTLLNVNAPSGLGPNRTYINEFVRNPEILGLFGGALPPVRTAPIALQFGTYLLDNHVGFAVQPGDIPGYVGTLSRVTSGAIGEVFVVPDLIERGRDGGNQQAYTWNPKVARYMWSERPIDSESIQLRSRAAYTFEAETPDWMGGKSRHTVTGGGQFTRDKLSIVSGGLNVRDTITYGRMANSTVPGEGLGKLGQDAYVLRQSVFDYAPIRYNGEPMGILGGLNFSRDVLGADLIEYLGNSREVKIAGSGWRDVTAYYRGAYAVYQGEFFNDRITFIGGLRHDSYQIREQEQLRILDGTVARNTMLTDESFGTGATAGGVVGYTVLPYLIGDGSQPYTPDRWLPNIPDALNLEIQKQVDLLRQSRGDNGTSRTLFPESQQFNTKTAGVSFRISEPLSVYLLYSEGVFPNQGQRDGLDRPVPAEQTRSQELGFKFDLLDRRISGTVSAYQIQRKNATWNFPEAPSPRRWIGGRLGPTETAFQPWQSGTPFAFDAQSYAGGVGVKAARYAQDSNPPVEFQRVSYGINGDFVEQVYKEITGKSLPATINQDTMKQLGLGFVWQQQYQIDGAQFENRDRQNVRYYWVDVERDLVAGKHINSDGVDMGLLMKEAIERAVNARDYDGDPIAWRHNEALYAVGTGNNPSNAVGDLVTFEEEAFGIDGQMIFSITNNYQAVFSFSYQKREVVGNGFNLAPLIDPITGQKVAGTPYDKWVYVLGADAFDDPTDPTTTNGKGVNGLDLSFAPKWNLSLWQKYTLREGPLTGMDFTFGVRFFGEAPTSVSIGDAQSAFNRYPTPPTKERFVLDAGINYSFEWMRARWRIGLKIDNLLDDVVSENVVEYVDVEDPSISHLRRSRVLYAPRTWRVSLTATF
jgi:outer membrane receptor protein involved in Fe transport